MNFFPFETWMEVTGTWVLRSQPRKYILACELGQKHSCFCGKGFYKAGHEEHLCMWRSKAVIRRDLLHPLGQPSTRTDYLQNPSVSILKSLQIPAGLSLEWLEQRCKMLQVKGIITLWAIFPFFFCLYKAVKALSLTPHWFPQHNHRCSLCAQWSAIPGWRKQVKNATKTVQFLCWKVVHVPLEATG